MVIRLKLALFLATFLAGSGCANNQSVANTGDPYEISLSGTDIHYRGEISLAANELLFALLEQSESTPSRLVITSGGGNIEAGMELGAWVFDNRVDVYVPVYCGSSCANYVFTAGNHKILGETALLMWHGGATQKDLGATTCDEGDWFLEVFDCDEDALAEHVTNMMMGLKAKEKSFFEKIGVDQRITILGQRPEFRCDLSETKSGWYYSIDDLKKLGVEGVDVLGEEWQPVPPSKRVTVCRVDLTRSPNKALHLQTTPVTLLASARTAPYASFKLA